MTVEAALRRTPLHEEHVALGGRLVPFAGWEMPIQYPGGIVAEHRATRASAGRFDLSHMGELRFRGPHALAALDRLVSADLRGLAVGHARYGLLTNERGTIVDDVIVYRLEAEDLLLVVNASNVDKDRAHLAAHLPREVRLDDESQETALIAVQGPRAVALAAAAADGDLAALPSFGVRGARIAGTGVIVARTGYTGEDGFEIFVPADGAVAVWRALDGAVAVGLGARDTLRLEARLSLYGNEIDETTNPIEAGLGWTCDLGKDFLGRDAIAAIKQRGPSRRLVGLVIEGGVARHGHPVVDLVPPGPASPGAGVPLQPHGRAIGSVTSGTYGPSVERNIALAYVPAERAAVGTRLAVRIRDRDVPATVTKTPFWRREGRA